MANIFFTSDTHFGHEGIIKHVSRPFPDSFTMDGELVRRWNSVVGPEDTVYHLGDLSFKGVSYTAHILEQLNGRIHWVLGNHDKALKNKQEIKARMSSIQPMLEVSIEGKHIVMCHYPMLTWNKAHYGSWMLHGHSHGTLKHPYPGMRLLDVGCDTHQLIPYSFAEVEAYMAGRQYNEVDHHTTKEHP